MRAIILVALLAGAGCVAPPPDPTAQAELHAPAAIGEPSTNATAPAAEAAAPAQTPPEPPGPPRIVVVEDDAKAQAAVGAPCLGAVRPCSRGPIETAVLSVPEGSPSAATMSARWNATNELATTGRIEVRAADGIVAETEGESPLGIELPLDALAAPMDLTVMFGPATGSAMVEQTAHVVLRLEYALPARD